MLVVLVVRVLQLQMLISVLQPQVTEQQVQLVQQDILLVVAAGVGNLLQVQVVQVGLAEVEREECGLVQELLEQLIQVVVEVVMEILLPQEMVGLDL